jgi:hypothetical protein
MAHKEDPPPTKREINKRLKKLHMKLSELDEMLSNADCEGEYYKIVDALASHIQDTDDHHHDFSILDGEARFNAELNYELACDACAETSISDLGISIRNLRDALSVSLKHFRSVKRGRPYLVHEVRIIEAIVVSYYQHFGAFPPARARGKFQDFITTALGYVGFYQDRWDRAIARAIDNLQDKDNTE